LSGARFAEKVVLVTGAAGGIGSATARRFSAEGAAVGLFDLNGERLESLCKELGGQAATFIGSVARPEDADAATTSLADRFGGIDVLVNCAGKISARTIESTTDEVWADLQDTNSSGTFRMVRSALPHMRGRDGASIVSISSMGGLLGAPQLVAYGAAKAAVIGMTKALAVELAPDGIRVNAICPGSIDTDMPRSFQAGLPEGTDASSMFWGRQLLKRFGTADEVASVIAFLASAEASFITGGVIPVDGGWSAW
jgi:NAD(P)-dependent dehydrogenase (short-subunit alcohol dehydrogenase family)